MKKLNLNFVWALLIGVALVTGCKKDETSSQPSTKFIEPSIAQNTEIVKLPAAIENSSDAYVSLLAGYANAVNVFGNYSSIFAYIPSNAQQTSLKSNGTSWTWSDGHGNAIWIEQIEETDHYTWNYYIKDADMSSRVLAITATELKTKLGGSLKVFDYQSTTPSTVSLDYNWSKDNTGMITATILFADNSSPMFFTMTSKPDTSGTLKIYNGSSASGTLFANYTWNSAGHGNYWYKDTSGHEYTNTF